MSIVTYTSSRPLFFVFSIFFNSLLHNCVPLCNFNSVIFFIIKERKKTCRLICRLTVEQYVGRCIDGHSNDMSPDTPANTWPVYQSTLRQYGECQLLVEYQLTVGGISVDYQGHTSQLSYNIICVFKSERGSWVSVSRTRYCSRGFEKSFCSVVRPGQPHHVNLLDFCCGSMHVIMLHCS